MGVWVGRAGIYFNLKAFCMGLSWFVSMIFMVVGIRADSFVLLKLFFPRSNYHDYCLFRKFQHQVKSNNLGV